MTRGRILGRPCHTDHTRKGSSRFVRKLLPDESKQEGEDRSMEMRAARVRRRVFSERLLGCSSKQTSHRFRGFPATAGLLVYLLPPRRGVSPSVLITTPPFVGSQEKREGCPAADSTARSARPRSTSSSTWGTHSSTAPSTGSSRSARSVSTLPLLSFEKNVGGCLTSADRSLPVFPSDQVGACKVVAEETFECLNRGEPLCSLCIDSSC